MALIIPTDSWWSTWLGNYLTWVLSRDKVIIEMTSGVTGRLTWEHTREILGTGGGGVGIGNT